MKQEKSIAAKIARDLLLSVFLYALPVLLMLLSFYISGERPWLNDQRLKNS
jgi:hypothetical protein